MTRPHRAGEQRAKQLLRLAPIDLGTNLKPTASRIKAIGLPNPAFCANRALDAHLATQRMRLRYGDFAVVVDHEALVEIVAIGVPCLPATRTIFVHGKLVHRHRATARIAHIGKSPRRKMLELGNTASEIDECAHGAV